MDNQSATLKSIAQQVGTSVTSVCRALNNKEGISEELKEKILKVAKESGYSLNYSASNLSKKATNILVIMPKSESCSRYYVKYIVDGYYHCKESLSKFKINFIEHFIDLNEESYIKLLTEIFNDKSRKIDGMIISPIRSNKIINFINRFVDIGVKVMLVDLDLPETDRLSCVKPNNEMAGKLAGELLCKLTHKKGKVIIADADVTVLDTSHIYSDINSENCKRMIESKRSDLLVEKVGILSSDNQLYNNILNRLRCENDIVALYATTARNTVSISNAVKELGLEKEVIIVGSEIFDENIEMLQNGTIDALIYKSPFMIGYEALKLLFNYLIRGEDIPEIMYITPQIILESNANINLHIRV